MASSRPEFPVPDCEEANETLDLEAATTSGHNGSGPEASVPCVFPGRGAEGEDINAPSPAKKKRKLDNYTAFESKEQRTLKTYESMESRIREIVNIMYKKLTACLLQENMSDKIKYLTNRLLTLKTKSSLDPIYIGLFGSTGAGKSSLLNAIIEHQFFLPVSGSETCTSCIVQVNTNRGNNYEAKIHLLSLEEWKEELKNLVELVKKPENEEEEGEEEEEGKEEVDVGEAVQKLRALYGKDAEARPYSDLLSAKLLVNIPASKCIQLKAEMGKELSDELDPYIRCHNDKDVEEPAQDDVRTKMRLWPLIKYVEVTIPNSDVIPEGVVFMDVPGTGDYNSKRDEMWKESINKCSIIWIISDIERIVGDKVHEVLLTESIKAYQGGMCSDIALVVTKSDKLHLEEYLRERKQNNKPIETKHDATLERNTAVKVRKSSRMKKKFKIPKLREYVKDIYLKEKKQLLMDYVSEALGIVLLAENFNSTRDMVNHYQQSDLETFVEEKIKDLEKEIEKCFAQLEQPLNEGVKQAKLSHENAFIRLLTRDTGYQGFHGTLKAVCQKNGVYASRTFARIDLNSALAQPIYDKINPMFANIFRIQMGTRASLKPCLDMFKDSVQKKIHDVGNRSIVANDSYKLKFFIAETNIILSMLERKILKKKLDIYQSLPLSIQSDLQPYYQEAAKIRGQRACQRMQNILKENIERKTKGGMFQQAKEKMKMQLQELKNTIMTRLRMDISTMLILALSHREEPTERLPDFQNELKEIERIYVALKGM